MSLTEIIGGQERTYNNEDLIPHSEWGRILYVPDGAAKSAIERSNSYVERIRKKGTVVRALTPAKDLPRILLELAKLKSANGPQISYAEVIKNVDLSQDFSFKTPRGTVIFQYPTPSETATAAG